MKLSEASHIIHGTLHGEDAHFFGASSDTRLLAPGELFFAWKGDNFDAHQFLESAAAKGAIAAVVERFIPSAELAQIVVDDSQKALAVLAKAWKKEWQGTTIALTGSNGKTTLKEMIRSILSLRHSVLATEGNFNNHVGCPLTLLKLSEKHDIAVIEMGANHAGEIAYLTDLVGPDIAIINNAGPCHLEGFGSIEGVANAKAEIYQGLTDNGVAVINGDDAYALLWKEKAAGHKQITFGTYENAQADLTYEIIEGMTFVLRYQDKSVEVSLNLLGAHNIRNSAAAAAAALMAGATFEDIKQGLEALMPVKGRLEPIAYRDHITLINDAYNANPNSLKAGINALKSPDRWVVLGDMRELGSDEIKLHKECGVYAKDAGVTRLFTLGDLSKHMTLAFGEGAAHYNSHDSLFNALQAALNDYSGEALEVLFKGSNSMNMPLVINALLKR